MSNFKMIIVLALAIFGIGTLFFSYNTYIKLLEAKGWPTSEGKVISSRIKTYWPKTEDRRKSHKMYTPQIKFKYFVNGKTYISNNVTFGEFSSSIIKDAEEVVHKYPENKKVTVYYDQVEPETAILEPGKLGWLWLPFAAVGGIFVFISTIVVISGIKTE